jgi:hypothetical protein
MCNRFHCRLRPPQRRVDTSPRQRAHAPTDVANSPRRSFSSIRFSGRLQCPSWLPNLLRQFKAARTPGSSPGTCGAIIAPLPPKGGVARPDDLSESFKRQPTSRAMSAAVVTAVDGQPRGRVVRRQSRESITAQTITPTITSAMPALTHIVTWISPSAQSRPGGGWLPAPMVLGAAERASFQSAPTIRDEYARQRFGPCL